MSIPYTVSTVVHFTAGCPISFSICFHYLRVSGCPNQPRNAHVRKTHCVTKLLYERRTKLLTTRIGHVQSGWSSIGCEGLYFHAMCENRVSVSGWSPIGCEGFRANLNIPSPLPTTLVFRRFCRLLIWLWVKTVVP